LQGKVNVVSRVVELLATSDNAVETNVYIARTAEVLAIDEASVRSELYKYLNKKDNQGNQGQDITIRSVTKKPEGASQAAERNLISIICSDSNRIPYIKARLTEEEFSQRETREIVTRLWQAWETEGELTAELDAMMDEPSLSEILSNSLLAEPISEDIDQVIDDCIKAVHLSHYQRLYEQHRLKADELERMGDSGFLQELAESQRIKNEISKLRNQQ
jgi:DNA primase